MKKIILFLLIFYMFSFCAIAVEPGIKGQQLFKEGLYSEALAAFNEAWSQDPEQRNYESYIELCKKMIKAQNLFNEAKYKESLLLTEETELLLPKDKKVRALIRQRKMAINLVGQTEEEYKNGNEQKILEAYQDLQDINPKDVGTAKAVEVYQQFIRKLDQARQLLRKGEWDDSLALYKEAWAFFPVSKTVKRGISINVQVIPVQEMFAEGKYKEAAVSYRKLFEKYPQIDIFREKMDEANKAAVFNISMRVAFAEGSFTEAFSEAEALLAISPDDAEAKDIHTKAEKVEDMIAEGDQFLADHEYLKAKLKYKQALKHAPQIASLQERDLVAETIIMGRKEKDEDFSAKGLEEFTTYKEFRNYVFGISQSRATLRKEIALVESMIKARKDGVKLFRSALYMDASEKLKEVLEVNPNDRTAISYLKKVDQALRYRKQIREKYLAGEDSAAKKIYRKLIMVNPNEKTYQGLLNELAKS